jgi:hypothetical protein
MAQNGLKQLEMALKSFEMALKRNGTTSKRPKINRNSLGRPCNIPKHKINDPKQP